MRGWNLGDGRAPRQAALSSPSAYRHKCANSKVGVGITSQAAFQFGADDTVMGLKLHPLSGKRGLTHMCSEEEGVADTVHHTTD